MKKAYTILLAAVIILLTGCMQDNSAKLIDDVVQNEKEGYYGAQRFPNNTEQNRLKHRADSELIAYAKEAGNFLEHSIEHLESIAPIMQQQTLSSSDISTVTSTIETLKNQSVIFENVRRPHEFQAFHEGHLTLIHEYNAIERVLFDMKTPVHPLQAENARVHYENAMMSHKLMEREFMSLSEKHGFY
ncbi:hypothetical protein [Bacillus sp. FJAT-45037]|uniref:hypothetical protein n=1 Tax=Bacillus sp. FJAT-45037 TaxID=2011007 RepID=UPI000C23397C|nr:hypothetical protein [Bacillus sp. FJAT-45037]